LTRIVDSFRIRGAMQTTGIIALASVCKLAGERRGDSLMRNLFRWEGERYDLRHNVHTAERVSLKTLDVVGSHAKAGSAYVAVRPPVLRELFSRLPIAHERFCFIDYGSGMGRVLLCASSYPFRGIIGVEFSPVLHAVAEQNI